MVLHFEGCVALSLNCTENWDSTWLTMNAQTSSYITVLSGKHTTEICSVIDLMAELKPKTIRHPWTLCGLREFLISLIQICKTLVDKSCG